MALNVFFKKGISILIIILFFFPLLFAKVGYPPSLTKHFLFFGVLFLFVVLIVKRKMWVEKSSLIIVLDLFFLFFYTLIISIIRGVYFLDYWSEIRGVYQNLLLFFIVINLKKINIQLNFDWLISVLILIQVFILILQYFEVGVIIDLTSFIDSKKVNLPHGTLRRYNELANLLTILYCYFLMKRNTNKVFLILIITAIFLTGNRIALIAVFISSLLAIYFRNRKLFFYIISIISVLILVFGASLAYYGEMFKYYETGDMSNPFSRFLSLFSLANVNNASDLGSSMSTVALNINMLDYVFQNFLFGCSGFFNFEYDLINPNTNNYTDVYLLWWIAELGIVGFALLIFPYFFILYKIRKKFYYFQRAAIIIFAGFILTITDMGVFSYINSFFIFLFLGQFFVDESISVKKVV
jgi:hypothetical protein